jgi:poly(3-hydroxybutyrate) depolymerase
MRWDRWTLDRWTLVDIGSALLMIVFGLCVLVVLPAIVIGGCVIPAVATVVGPDEHGARVEDHETPSRFVARARQVTVIPGGARAARPLLVLLHAPEGGPFPTAPYKQSEFFAALAALGDRAPVVVFPEDGSFVASSYAPSEANWGAPAFEPEPGEDWEHYVLDEVIPQAVRRSGADPRRVAIGGFKGGGFDAFAIARSRPERFCAVGGHSPWVGRTDSKTEGAYERKAEDFPRN